MITVLIIAAVLVLILLLPVTLRVSYDEDLLVKVKIGFVRVYVNHTEDAAQKAAKSAEDAGEKMDKSWTKQLKQAKEFFSVLQDLLHILLEHVKKYVTIKKVRISYTFGFSDAAATGIFSGAVYAVVHGFLAYLDSAFKVQEHQVEIQPDFNQPRQEFAAELVVRILMVHLVTLVFKLLGTGLKGYQLLKGKQEAVK